MNREELFQALGAVDEELLTRCDEAMGESQTLCQRPGGHKRTIHWPKWAGAAACIGLLLTAGAGILLSDYSPEPSTPKVVRNETASMAAASPASKDTSQLSINDDSGEASQYYVDINPLLIPPLSEKGGEGEVLRQAILRLNGRNAIYESIPFESSDQLKEAAGARLADNKDWYLLSGHEEMQYLIQKEKKDVYSLWEFDSFENTPYPYKEVLEEIYGIRSADDIAKVVVSPAQMDNTDAGKALQKKIGVFTIDDPEKIAAVYEILSSLTCLGTDDMEDWKLIGLTDDSPEAMLRATRYGRYLTIVTSRGNRRITHLKYNGINDVFYQYGGIGYQALKKKEAAKLAQILKIQ